MELIFTDVSKWNGIIDWPKQIKNGIEGTWLKASGCGVGGNYVDYRFKENSYSCPLKYRGAYHYFDYEGRKSGKDQAKFFLDTCGDFGNMRGVLDLEDNSGGGWTKLSTIMGKALKEALAWVTEYYIETNHYPILYLNTGLTTQKQLTSTGYKYAFRNFVECPLWVANYNNINIPPTGAWDDYAAWQYTSAGDGLAYGNSPGNNAIDLNRIKNISLLLKPGIAVTQPDPVNVEPTDAEKLRILWEAYKSYQK